MLRGLVLPCLTLLALTPGVLAQNLDSLCKEFSGFDRDGDGIAELAKLRGLDIEGDGPLVLCLVEDRLIADNALGHHSPIPWCLDTWSRDLIAEGWSCASVVVSFGQQQEHRDGSVLLALRAFLKRAHAELDLAGVVLVGRFPDAFLVRTCNWRKHEALTLHKGKEQEQTWKKVRFVRRVPEAVAHRCDIVLADLDGDWESKYVGPRVSLPATYAVFEEGVPRNGGLADAVQHSSVAFEDFFHLSDGRLEVVAQSEGRPWVSLDDQAADFEVPLSERALPNALATPEIFVSRMDASGIALSPNPQLTDANGRTPLDAQGCPQELQFADARAVPSWSGDELWVFDPELERLILFDYFSRNHAYRNGQEAIAFRPASIACDLGSGYASIRAASASWAELYEKEADLRGKPKLTDFLRWLQRPAVLRTVRAHSDPWGSVFGKGDLAALDAVFAETPMGAPMAWTPDGNRLKPSLRKSAGGGKLDFFLLRSLWNSGLLPTGSSLYLHTGCHGISPPQAASRAFQHPSYGRRGGGESLLFFGKGLAMVGRAKVFYDEPRGFAQELAAGHTIGHAWARYFEEESQSSWKQAGGDIGRKRSYFWSVLGDWTLRLEEPAP